MYNRIMNRFFHLGCGVAASVLFFFSANAQAPPKSPAAPAQSPQNPQRAMSLAESGHCAEALPLLKKSIHQVTDRDLKKRIGLLGLNCAMTHNAPYDSLDFLAVLNREFPRDPEVLYAAAHAFSDLSLRASQQLVREAPFLTRSMNSTPKLSKRRADGRKPPPNTRRSSTSIPRSAASIAVWAAFSYPLRNLPRKPSQKPRRTSR